MSRSCSCRSQASKTFSTCNADSTLGFAVRDVDVGSLAPISCEFWSRNSGKYLV